MTQEDKKLEIWKPIPNYGEYEVSIFGRVKRLAYDKPVCGGSFQHCNERMLSPQPRKNGYQAVVLSKKGVVKSFLIHRLVALTFIPNPDNLPQVNHKDGNKSNNYLDNLEWCTCKENIHPALRTGLIDTTRSVCQYDLDGNFIKEFDSITQAEKETFILGVNITSCCRDKVRQSGGYQWKYYKQDNIGKVRAKKIADDLKTRYCKRVAAFQDGIEVRRFNSVLEASEFIGKPHANVNISACALGKRKSAYGYQWQYM